MDTTPWHALSIDDTLRQLDTRADGLTAVQAAKRLERLGRNEITQRKPISAVRLFLKQFANFFVLVLLFAAALAYARTMLFTGIVLHAFTRVMVVRQLDDLPLWSNPILLWSYAAAVGLQLLALYTPLRNLFGVVPLHWRAWAVMIPVVAGSSLAGVYMTRWILKLVPLWEQ